MDYYSQARANGLTPLGKAVVSSVAGAAAVGLGHQVSSYLSGDYENVNKNDVQGTSARIRSGRGAGQFAPINKGDLQYAVGKLTNVPSRVPKSIGKQIFWTFCKVPFNSFQPQTTVTEVAYQFSLTGITNYAHYVGIFDQYCLVQVSLTFLFKCAPGETQAPTILHTAIDLDNNNSLSGNLMNLDSYSSAVVTNCGVNTSVTRTVRPYYKFNVATGNNVGLTRTWIDCAQATATTCTSIRAMTEVIANNTTSQIIYVEACYWAAFRNEY